MVMEVGLMKTSADYSIGDEDSKIPQIKEVGSGHDIMQVIITFFILVLLFYTILMEHSSKRMKY